MFPLFPADRIFYVYIYFYLSGIPCYVGKGSGGRWKEHLRDSHNKQLRGLINKSGGSLPIVIVRDNLTNEEAIELEIHLIQVLGRIDQGKGPLVNHTNGGDGVPGASFPWLSESNRTRVWTKESKEKLRRQAILRMQDPQARENLRTKGLAHMANPENRKKSGAKNIGRVGSERQREAVRIAATNRKKPADEIEKVANFHRGRKRPAETSERLRNWHASMSPEQKAERSAKISATVRATIQLKTSSNAP